MFNFSVCLIFVTTVALFAGCSDKTIKIFPTDNFTKEAKNKYDSTLAELERNRRLWSEKNVRNYEFHCEQFQGGIYTFVAVLIKVRDGKPSSFEVVGKDEELMRKDDYDKMTSFENMFDFIRQELENGRIIDVKYHETGYPTEVRITYSYNTDSSRLIKISEFKVE